MTFPLEHHSLGPFARRCAASIEPNRKRIDDHPRSTPTLVTNPCEMTGI
jgi:hypothetical protein